MRGHLRKGDVFAAVGILMLLVWTPAYLAAEPAAQDLSDGETFSPPAPRAGDRVVQDLVVTDAAGVHHVARGICTITYRVPEKGESPLPAVLVEERHWPAMELRIGPITYRSHEFIERSYFGADGTVVWFAYELPDPEGGEPLIRSAAYPQFPWDDVNGVAGHEIAFAASSAVAGARGVVDAAQTRLHFALSDRPLPEDPVENAGVVAVYEGNVVFGTGGLEEYVERIDDLSRKYGPGRFAPAEEDEAKFGRLPDIFFRFIDGVGKGPVGDQWTWFSPDAAVPVGAHREYAEGAPLHGWSVDVLPREIVRGDGPVLRVAPAQAVLVHDNMQRLFRPVEDRYRLLDEPLVPLIRVGDIESDPTPLYRGWTLAELKSLLAASDPPGEVRRALADGARIVEFSWYVLGDRTLAAAGDTVIPSPLSALPGTERIHSSVWALTLLDDRGRHTVVALEVDEVEGGEVTGRASLLCDGQERWEAFRCATPRQEPLSWNARVVPPSWPLGQIARFGHDRPFDGMPQIFNYLPGFQEAPDRDDGPHGVRTGYQGSDCHTEAHGSKGQVAFGTLVAGGAACWQVHDGESDDRFFRGGTLRLADGVPLAVTDADFATAGTGPSTPTTTTTAAHYERLDVPDATWATGGLLLVLFSALLRGTSWLKAGGFFPAVGVLYAKISRAAVLDHERRAEILEVIRVDPGVTARELAQRTGYAWGVVVHHLMTLERNGLVRSLTVGKHRSFFDREAGSPMGLRLLAAARNPDDKALLDALAAPAGATVSELAERLDRKPSSISRSGRRLAAFGVLDKVREGGSVRYRLRTP